MQTAFRREHISVFYTYAKLYQRIGLLIFPVARLIEVDGRLECSCTRGHECGDPGKHPAWTGWGERASASASPWFMGALDNIGIATGKRCGIFVVDVDPRNGGTETLAGLEREHGPLPPTWRFLTGGGGEHIVFRHPGFYIAGDSSGATLGPGIDIKGEGGLIVAPPSLHMSGRRYAISVDHHPDEVPLADAPDWLLAKLRNKQHQRQQRQQRPEEPVPVCNGLSRFGEAELDKRTKRVLNAPNGQQRHTLNGQSWAIGRIAGAGALPVEFSLKVMLRVAARIVDYDPARPWRAAEIEKKVQDAFWDGMRNPRKARR